MNEPSVLDYVKAKIMPWKYSLPDLMLSEDVEVENEHPSAEIKEFEELASKSELSVSDQKNVFTSWIPWKSVIALVAAIGAQTFLEPPDRAIPFSILLYAISAIFLIWSIVSGEWRLQDIRSATEKELKIPLRGTKLKVLMISFFFMILAFFAFRGNHFTTVNLLLWGITLGLFLYAVLDWGSLKISDFSFMKLIKSPNIQIRITPFAILILAGLLLSFFFRFYQLDTVLGEMFSDHAEKLADVYDVLNGQFSIFFPRNTGREFLQFYLTALVAIVFRTGISFMSLKIGTALIGFITLPYIYKLGKEIGNRWVGLFAMVFAGVSYWHNVISRVGLRFPLYPLFVAPTLFYLIRGLRKQNRNDFIFAGIFLGLGLHGYSPIRFLPVVVIAAVFIYLLHQKLSERKNNVLFALIILAVASFILFLPLFTYAIENPDMFGYRMISRLGTTERAYIQSPLIIFLDNLWKASIMFFYSNGNTWVHSIPLRPALDIISAALYFIGTLFVFIRYIKYRNWEDLFLLVSVPLLMMTSILSLAFPEENPSLNRTGGAIIPVFIIIGFGFHGFLNSLWIKVRSWFGKFVVIAVGISLFLSVALMNYDLVFRQFNEQFMAGAWNTSQIGEVIKGFSESVGSPDHAYVVPYPHWVDTRLVGINAGYPTKDYALWPDHFSETLAVDEEKMFIVKPENQEALDLLKQLYPQGYLYYYDSGRSGKDFLIFTVPPKTAANEDAQP